MADLASVQEVMRPPQQAGRLRGELTEFVGRGAELARVHGGCRQCRGGGGGVPGTGRYPAGGGTGGGPATVAVARADRVPAGLAVPFAVRWRTRGPASSPDPAGRAGVEL